MNSKMAIPNIHIFIFRDIAYLHDLSDEDEEPLSNSRDFLDSSNNNTMETASSRSFGFIRPNVIKQPPPVVQQQQQDQQRRTRVRRHKSFFSPNSQVKNNLK